MDISNPVYMTYTPKETSHVKDNLYWMMVGDEPRHEWDIDRGKMKQSGFQLVHRALSGGSVTPCAATFHHNPSGSTVLLEDDIFRPLVEIFGERKEEARNALVALVRPYGFELMEKKDKGL